MYKTEDTEYAIAYFKIADDGSLERMEDDGTLIKLSAESLNATVTEY